MKVLVIAVAGKSSRFSESIGKECLKCIYTEHDKNTMLLYRMISINRDYDEYVIVGGHMFNELKQTIDQTMTEFRDRIHLVKNDKYEEYGSGYSLYIGIGAALKLAPQQITFAEGDLYLSENDFKKVTESDKDVITYNYKVIKSEESVVFYINERCKLNYVYDTSHELLRINEPFKAIYNSGQVWKFTNMDRLISILNESKIADWKDTNLYLINKYFNNMS